MPCQVFIEAVGTKSNPLLTQATPDLKLNKWGNIIADDNGMTSIPGVFAGGDIVRGGATVILAMGDGKKAAANIDAYREEEVRGEKRVVLGFNPDLAPYKVAVLPLLKKRDEIVGICHKLREDLAKDIMAVYDDTAAIGKLYRRQDEIGTPWCVTIDVDSLEDGKATIRDRDSMEQIRVDISQVKPIILERLAQARA